MIKNMSTLPCGRKKPSNTPKNTQKTAEWKVVLTRYLKDKKLRATTQRERVAEMIFIKKSHFDVQTLIKEVQTKHPEIGPATIYRSVNTLCDAGLLQESLQSNSGVTLYEAIEEEHHDHIICLDCGEIFEFHDEAIEEAQSKALRKMGFQQAKHKHVIYAKCALLAKNRKGE
jgi:Fur family ferric uptake transcriptional regulator